MNAPPETYQQLRAIYGEMAEKFAPLKTPYGYKIFNAPPRVRAPVMFIGYQPGGGLGDWESERSRKTHTGWPDVAEYATAQWQLAIKLRAIFEGSLDLRQTVGLNAIFARAPDVKRYRSEIPLSDRREIEKFSSDSVIKIIEELKPQKIISIGFDALKRFGEPMEADLKNVGGRALTKKGSIAGKDALAVIHLTGARISNEDFASLRTRMVEYAGAKN